MTAAMAGTAVRFSPIDGTDSEQVPDLVLFTVEPRPLASVSRRKFA
jgi:hypothetical protein